MARGPLESDVEIGNLDDAKASEELLGFGVGAVVHLTLAVSDRDGGSGLWGFESSAPDEDASCLESSSIGPAGRLSCGVVTAIKYLLRLVNE